MTRTCPHCGFEEDSARERCTRCGRSVLVAPPRLQGRRRTAAIAGAIAAVVIVVAVVAIVISGAASSREKRDAAANAKAVAAERVRLDRLQAPHRGAAPDLRPKAGATDAELLAARAALRARVEAAITADARRRAQRGELDGPIRRSECGPFLRAPDAVPDDKVLSKPIGRYDCVAIKKPVAGNVGDFGYPFVAALDFRRFTFVWCRNTPAQSERGQALAFVRLARPCLAAKGRALGTGYVDVPGS